MNLDSYSDDSRRLGYNTCECGRERTPGSDACERCTYLDGTRDNAQIIDVLRGTDGLSVSEIAAVLGKKHKEGVQRSLDRLRRIGRVRRYWRDGDSYQVERRLFGQPKARVTHAAHGHYVYALDGLTERQWEASCSR